MAIIRLPVVELTYVNLQTRQFVPVSSVNGGLLAMVFAVSGAPYRLIGFSIEMNLAPVPAGQGVTLYVDGRERVPLQITLPPNLSPIARGELEIVFNNMASPQNQTSVLGVTGYAKLEGVIYPGVSLLYVQFVLPNVTNFIMGGNNTAALIVEDFNEGNEGDR